MRYDVTLYIAFFELPIHHSFMVWEYAGEAQI